MAKQYGKNSSVDFAAANLMSFGKSFSRLSGQPLDKSEIWYDNKAALEAYALTDAAYVGQKVVYIDTTENKVYHYGIEIDGTLKEIGTSPIGDEDTIVVAEDGTVSLAGVSGLTLEEEKKDEEGQPVLGEDGQPVIEKYTYQPLLVEGKLTWVRPSATTVEGLASEIAGIKDNTYTKSQVYTRTEVEAKIAEAGHLKRQVVEKLPVVENPAEGEVQAVENVVYMIKDANAEGDMYKEYMLIDGAVVQIGDTSTDLSQYKQWIDSNVVFEPHGLPIHSSVRDNDLVMITSNGGLLTSSHLNLGELSDWINGKMDAPTDGSRLITADEGTLLGTLESGAEKNVIDGANEKEFTIENRVLSVKEIEEGKVAGLTKKLETMQESIDKKVEQVEGKGLSKNDFTDTLLAKLNAIDENAQVNVLEEVHINGTKLEITEKAVNIPVASAAALGVVRSSTGMNSVAIATDGTMSVDSIGIDKLVNIEGAELILDGGSSSNVAAAV